MRWVILHFGVVLRYMFYVSLFLVVILNYGWEDGLPRGILYAFFFIMGLYFGAWFSEICRKYVRGLDKGGMMERVMKGAARCVRWILGGLFVVAAGLLLVQSEGIAKEWWYTPFFTGGLFGGSCIYQYCVGYINRDWRERMVRMKEYDKGKR